MYKIINIKKTLTNLLDFFLPPLCLNCDAPVAENGTLCAKCWQDVHFIAPPFCACCGLPFDFDVEAGTQCGKCLSEPPLFDKARAAMLYNDGSKKFILRFKHSDRIHPSATFALWMMRAGNDLWSDVDVLVPVPLHRWRLLRRRYNQSALLAKLLAKNVNKPACVDALIRFRATHVQEGKKKIERQKNLRNSIKINIKQTAKIKGKTVALIDDVLTTGATANECARILLESGAKRVVVISLAHTPLINP